MSLLVLGSVAFDAIETPFGKTDKIIGGAATYVVYTASYFVNPVNLVAVVGEDFPQDTIADMNKRGVDTEGLEIRQGEKSFFWSGRYHQDMNSRDTLVTELNVMENFDPKIPDAYKKPEFVMLGNFDPDIQISVVDQLEEKPKLIAMDSMNLWMDIKMESVKKALKKIDLLTINDEEARQLSGEYSLRKAARKIMDMGPDYLVIKKGEHGALLFHGERIFFAPALPLEEVFDPTGAGDSFAGGFIGHLAKTNDLSFENMKQAVIYGSAMASFTVEKFGVEQLEDLNDDKIRSRATEFAKLVSFELS